MTTLLIVEGNPKSIIARGSPEYAIHNMDAFHGIDPSVTFLRAAPYDEDLSDDTLDQADGVIFTGSSVDWDTSAPEAAPQRAAMERVFARGLPVWGSCNGMQLAASVLGGSVGASPNGVEIGLARDVQLTEAGQAHPMMAGRKSGFAVPCIHRDEVQRLPDGAVLIAGNAHSPVQAIVIETGGVDFWGTQYHPEVRPALFAVPARAHGNGEDLARNLERAEADETAAEALGAMPGDLRPGQRRTELANWLNHVRARALATV